MANVAFIGLGNMGGGMAANLAKAGHQVRAFDLSENALAKAAERGCSRVTDAAAAVEGADAVITMLPAGKHVAEVFRSAVFGKAPTGAILIDCSTIDLQTAEALDAEARAGGYQLVFAPVSGGIAAADAGTLTFMAGGTPEAFERARSLLENMGKAIIHAGGPTAGLAAKLCNNLILAATMAVTCEGFVLAQKLGLDPQTFFDIASKATGQSWSMTSYCPVPGVGPESPADRNYDGGFASALMLKDLRLAMEAAQAAGAYTPMGGEAEELYARFVDRGGATKDFSAIIKMIDDSWTPAG